MARQQLVDVFEKSFSGKAELKCEIVFKACQVRFDLRNERQQRFHFGSEIKSVAHGCVIDGLDTKPIARAEEFALALIPQCECKHATQAVDAILAPLSICLQNNFCIRSGAKVFAT